MVRHLSSSVFCVDAQRCASLLGKALELSSFSVQEKVAFALLLPEMRLDQLVRFATIVNTMLKKQMEQELGDVFRSVQQCLETHVAIQTQQDHTFMTETSSIVQEFRHEESLKKTSL